MQHRYHYKYISTGIAMMLIVMFMLLPVSGPGQTATATIGQHAADPGTQVVVPVEISGFNDVGSVTIFIAYDDNVLTYKSSQNFALTGFSSNAFILNGTPVVGIAWSSAVGVNFPDGVLFEIVFEYSNGSSSLVFTPTCEIAQIIGNDILDLEVDYTNGSVIPDYWIWNGSSSQLWNDAANWSKGSVPPAGKAILIDAFLSPPVFPLITGQQTAEYLHISGDIFLSIGPGGALTALTILDEGTHAMGAIVIESTVQGTGSLLHNADGVHASVQRHISGNSNGWHQISSPVEAQPVAPEFSNDAFLTFYEPAYAWVNFQNTTVWPTWLDANLGSNHFIKGKGYMIAAAQNATRVFSGALNQGAVSFTLSRTAHPADNPGYNLMGNPYPSAIDWKASNGWEGRNNLQNDAGGYTFWIWSDADGNYGSWNSASSINTGTLGVSRYIAPMQGFFVKAAGNGGVVAMNNQVRVHNSQEWIKNEEAPHVILNLHITGTANAYRDMVIVEMVIHGAGGGAEKMFSLYDDAPGLYIAHGQHAYSIFFHNVLSDTSSLALNLVPGTAAMHAISAEGANHFSQLLLEDLKLGITHDLKQHPTYHFSAAPGDDAQRFMLHLKEASSAAGPYQPAARLYYSRGMIVLDNPHHENTTIEIYDHAGRLMQQFTAGGQGRHQWSFAGNNGIYFYKLSNSKTLINGKLFISTY